MSNNKLAITICATKKYTYALTAQIRRIQSATSYIKDREVHIIYCGDNSQELKRAHKLASDLMPQFKHKLIDNGLIEDGHKNYNEQSQLLIAQLRSSAFSFARSLGVDTCLSLDSDVLPPPNAIKCMEQMLEFDDGYYSISTCTYPSQGGGGFLGGRGSPQRQIFPDFYEDERQMPEDVTKKMKELREFVFKLRIPKDIKDEERKEIEEKIQELQILEKDLDKYPPKGNVWELNAKGWKPRGWLENSYPALGKGAIAYSDWCGFGCTMMNKEALNWSLFDGYDGKGTEDLYIIWNRWHQRDLKICVMPHCLCDHVIRDKQVPNKYILCQSHHETEGDCKGHIRMRYRPFYSQDIGEKFDINNNGKMTPTPIIIDKQV